MTSKVTKPQYPHNDSIENEITMNQSEEMDEDQSDEKQQLTKKRTVFLSLQSDDRAKRLDDFINALKQKSETYNATHNVSGIQKTRKNVRENFTYSLVTIIH